MLSIVIPTLDSAAHLPRALVSVATTPELAHEVIVTDGGSRDDTREIAARAGARVVVGRQGRGVQLRAGAEAAKGDWLLFLHADTALAPGWAAAVRSFIARPDSPERAAVFHFALDDEGPAARRLVRLVAWRTRMLGLPYGDQGLLISRQLYDRLGGFRPLPLMEDVDLVRRVGRRRMVTLDATAVTSAARYRAEGYLRRSARNLVCLGLYYLGVPPAAILRLYR